MKENETGEMPFLDHLEELRWRIIKSVIAVIVTGIIIAFFSDFFVHNILLGPLHKVGLKAQVLTPYGIMVLYMEVILITSIIVSMPIILYQLWKFIVPGLLPNERRYVWHIVFFTSLCFFLGVSFGYFIILPTSLKFFSSFGTEYIELNVAADKYISFVTGMMLVAGLIFELPMIAYFLSKLDIVTPVFMRKYRRHAIIVILIISAVVTPTPDIVTQLLLSTPMIVLYEISIFISKLAQKKPLLNNE